MFDSHVERVAYHATDEIFAALVAYRDVCLMKLIQSKVPGVGGVTVRYWGDQEDEKACQIKKFRINFVDT